MTEQARLLVMASGNGSNFQVLLEACRSGQIAGEIVQLICDRREAKAVQRATQEGVAVRILSPADFSDREEHHCVLLEALQQAQPDLIVLAGYMRLLAPQIVAHFYGRIINIHPSLLPDFSGINAIERAWQAGVAESGVTVHYVDSGLDSGPIIAQRRVVCAGQADFAAFRSAIQQQEHQLLPAVVNALLKDQISLQGRQVIDRGKENRCEF